MKWRNPLDKEVTFALRERRISVPAGGLVEIPDRFDFMVEHYGLPLVRAEGEVAPALSVRDEDVKVLAEDGPTLEEWVASGYKPDTYPPEGYAEKQSPGLTKYRAKQAKK